MTYWIRWQSADGTDGPRIGPFNHRQEAEAALLNQVRAAADALEHGTGKAGVWTPDGALYRDDLDDRFLGRYIIEQVARVAARRARLPADTA
jgi:hypothetical protein